MQIVEQVTGFINSVPRVAIVAVAFIVVMGIFAIWKYMSKKGAEKEIPAPVAKVEPEPKETAPLIKAAPAAPPTAVVPPAPKELEPYGTDSDSDGDFL
jgi:negative regulator of sigma E activity